MTNFIETPVSAQFNRLTRLSLSFLLSFAANVSWKESYLNAPCSTYPLALSYPSFPSSLPPSACRLFILLQTVPLAFGKLNGATSLRIQPDSIGCRTTVYFKSSGSRNSWWCIGLLSVFGSLFYFSHQHSCHIRSRKQPVLVRTKVNIFETFPADITLTLYEQDPLHFLLFAKSSSTLNTRRELFVGDIGP